MTIYCYANLKVPPPCQMKKTGTITAINFHVSLVKQQIFTVTYFGGNSIYLNYHISAHILLLQVFVGFNVTFNNLLVSSFMLSTFLYFFFLVFRSTDETTSAKLPIVILMTRDKFHEGEAKLTYRTI